MRIRTAACVAVAIVGGAIAVVVIVIDAVVVVVAASVGVVVAWLWWASVLSLARASPSFLLPVPSVLSFVVAVYVVLMVSFLSGVYLSPFVVVVIIVVVRRRWR